MLDNHEIVLRIAEHPLGIQHAAQRMIGDGDQSSRREHLPVKVERKEGERTENMEMSFSVAVGDLDEQSRHRHLAHRDHMSGTAFPGTKKSHQYSTQGDGPPAENG